MKSFGQGASIVQKRTSIAESGQPKGGDGFTAKLAVGSTGGSISL